MNQAQQEFRKMKRLLCPLLLPQSAPVMPRYGAKNTVPMVVLKAEFAQSYIAQPKISLLSFIIAVSFAIHPPN